MWKATLLLILQIVGFDISFAGFSEKALLKTYGNVQDWVFFSPRPNITLSCQYGIPLKVAYVTRHTGTLWDWIAIAQHLGAPWTRVNPGRYITYGINNTDALTYFARFGDYMCHIADIIIVSDTIADARPFLLGNCETPIVLQMTNRFDYGIQPNDYDAYILLLRKAVSMSHVYWVSNNPYDFWYAEWKLQISLPSARSHLFRPVGVGMISSPSFFRIDKRLAIIRYPRLHLEYSTIQPWLDETGLRPYVDTIPRHYGGPRRLASYRGIISVPYQVSVMKLYEGMAAGAVFVVPSPSLFAELLRRIPDQNMSFCCRSIVLESGLVQNWTTLTDWYHPDLSPGIIYFDSFDELKRLIIGGRDLDIKFADLKKRAVEVMRTQRLLTLQGYTDLYSKLSMHACAFSLLPDILSQGYAG